jgi:hypothetical protein
MKIIAAFFAWLWHLLAGSVQQPAKADERYRLARVEDLPDAPAARTLYIVGEEPHAWAAAMLCPCGCGDPIQLSLLEEASPSWRVIKEEDNTMSLMPSVWRRKGCQSHFFLHHGKILWCGGGTRYPDVFVSDEGRELREVMRRSRSNDALGIRRRGD